MRIFHLVLRSSRFAIVTFLIVAVIGCNASGPPVGRVNGKVTFRGDPVGDGTVSFQSKEYAADAKLSADGTYEFDTEEGGLLVGDYEIMILAPLITDSSDPRSPPVIIQKDVPNIPNKYRNVRTSGFRATVKEGKNEHNFDMQ